MTPSDTPEANPADDSALPEALDASEVDADAGDEPEPPPEPWTPERVLEWNAYYDMYVAIGLLVLVFLGSSNLITSLLTWAQLAVGRQIAAEGRPLTVEPFALVQSGQSWANVSWLHALGSYQVFKLVSGFAPSDPDPVIQAERAEQFGAGALVVVHALARMFTALILLGIRRKGPGLWWTAICTMMAVGVFISPAGAFGGSALGVVMGGIAGPATVQHEPWGLLLLAVELYVLFRAGREGGASWAFGLVPLFVLWANVDEAFLVGLIYLAAYVAGRAGSTVPGSLSLGRGLAVLGASAAACLLNPTIHRAYIAALEPFLALFAPDTTSIFPEEISFFGQDIRDVLPGNAYRSMVAYYVIVVAAGLGSFVLNRNRFSLSRFLVYAAAATLWGVFYRMGGEFALVFAATLALNGQEWYQDQFGVHGKLGRGWALWSIGGRAATIVVLFAAVTRGVTGLGGSVLDPTFGFGFRPEDFPFEAATALRGAKLEGNVLNTTAAQGDAILWRATPSRRPYIDSRAHAYSRDFREEHQKLRRALSEDDIETWKPMLDAHGVSTVMIQPSGSPRTYTELLRSERWIPFYDDGAVVMFGRADASPADVAYFTSEQLEADPLAYTRPKPVPPASLPPSTPSWLDRIVARSGQERTQPHTEAAARWFRMGGDANSPTIPDPARCLLAIRECRAALGRNPNDTVAFRLLSEAYRYLMVQESALLAGMPLTPETAAQVAQVAPRSDILRNRFLQRLTAVSYAIQTTPPTSSPEAKRELAQLHLELGQLFAESGTIDLARDHLEEVLDPVASANLDPAFKAQLSQELVRLKGAVEAVQKQISDAMIEATAGPFERASIAAQGGALGMAIEELKEAQLSGVNPGLVLPTLVDLYCQTGQPDKAIDLLSDLEANPAPNATPGTSGYRSGVVSFLIGNYAVAIDRWQNDAISSIRSQRTAEALMAGQNGLKGELKMATSTFLEVPGKVNTQASWEYEVAMAMLEAGEKPDLVAEHFTAALTLAPDLPQRPIAAYYLEKLGKPVPALPVETEAPATEPSPMPPADPAPAAPAAAEPAPAPGEPTPAPAPPA